MPKVYNVPDVPGVPLLNFAPGYDQGIELLDTDGFISPDLFGPQWGIFLDGVPVVVADSVIDMSLKKEWAISDYPVEQGGFASYDKVYIPFDARVRFSAGGSAANRQALLDSIDAIAGDLNLYDIPTPETVYSSCNVVHYDYKRSAQNGAGLILVDVWLFQVVVLQGSAAFSNTKDPSSTAQVNGGTVQPTAPTAAQSSAASGSIGKTGIPGGEGGTPGAPIVLDRIYAPAKK